MTWMIEDLINGLRNQIDWLKYSDEGCDWTDMHLNTERCRQLAEWLEELVELRKRFGNEHSSTD